MPSIIIAKIKASNPFFRFFLKNYIFERFKQNQDIFATFTVFQPNNTNFHTRQTQSLHPTHNQKQNAVS